MRFDLLVMCIDHVTHCKSKPWWRLGSILLLPLILQNDYYVLAFSIEYPSRLHRWKNHWFQELPKVFVYLLDVVSFEYIWIYGKKDIPFSKELFDWIDCKKSIAYSSLQWGVRVVHHSLSCPGFPGHASPESKALSWAWRPAKLGCEMAGMEFDGGERSTYRRYWVCQTLSKTNHNPIRKSHYPTGISSL